MRFISEQARTLQELFIYPASVPIGLDQKKVNLRAPLAAFNPEDEESRLYLNIPFMGAIMQSLAGPRLLAEISMRGGCGFTPSSIPLDHALDIYRKTKKIKAGFVDNFLSTTVEHNLESLLGVKHETGYSTVPILRGGRFVGIITSDDYWRDDNPSTKIDEMMTKFVPYTVPLPIEKINDLADKLHKLRKEERWDEIGKEENSQEYLEIRRIVKGAEFIYGTEGLSLKGANLILRMSKRSCIPILDKDNGLLSLVFKKDYLTHADNPLELTDDNRRPMVGVGLNTRDYRERVTKMADEGATLFCFDSSHVNDYQTEAIKWCRKNYPGLIFGGGNIIDGNMFLKLANAGADFCKVGIGGGSICITREQQAVGVGQATAVMDVAEARDIYRTNSGGIYVPIISDGGIVFDHDIMIALALGADGVMMGRYFARFDEHPWPYAEIRGIKRNPYWGEGSLRAKNWQRYGETSENFVEQGVDGFVPRVGPLKATVEDSLKKLKKTMVDYLGAMSLKEFTQKAVVRPGSQAAVSEAGAHDLLIRSDMGLSESVYKNETWGT